MVATGASVVATSSGKVVVVGQTVVVVESSGIVLEGGGMKRCRLRGSNVVVVSGGVELVVDGLSPTTRG